MYICLKILAFLLFSNASGAKEKCEKGIECVSIEECKVLKVLIHGTASDRHTVTTYHCGYDRDVPRVCCPPSDTNVCPTREGTLGICVSLENCRHLLQRMNTGKAEDIEYVQRSRCAGPTHFSVCCNQMLNNTIIDTYSVPLPSKSGDDTDLTFTTECSVLNESLGVISSNDECCGIESDSANKIIGGEETAIDEYPWLAMLEYERPNLCGGTLISKFYVLTAAHCLVNDNMKPRGVKSVRLGEYNTENEGRDCVEVEGGGQDCTDGAISINIAQSIPHPQYNSEEKILKANDIGLLKLEKGAPYTEFIRPICLPKFDLSAMSITPDVRYYAAGWGAISNTIEKSIVKLQVDLPIIKQEDCQKLYSNKGTTLIWNKQFCAGGELDKDTCRGDSGGPLTYEDAENKINEIIGITSFGVVKCGSRGRSSIYTKVFDYIPWILNNTKI